MSTRIRYCVSGLLGLALLLLAGAAAASPVASLAGHYSHHFKNGLVSGETYWSDDVVEIVPVDTRHAYIRLELAFFNGHSCSLSGIAEARGEALIYQGPADDTFDNGAPCRLTIGRRGEALAWDDGGTCMAHCGARGSLRDGTLPWSSRRAITYMKRLTASSDYRDALAEWRKGEAPAN